MSRLPPVETEEEGLIGKVAHGRLDRLNRLDGMQAARLAAGLTPTGQIIDPVLAGAEGVLESDKEMSQYRRDFGPYLERMAHRNPGFRRKLKEVQTRWRGRIGEAATSSATGIATGAALTGLFGLTGPVGWAVGLGGMMAGSFAGSKAYNAVFSDGHKDGVAIVRHISQMQQNGEYVPPEVVYAALAANLPDRVGKRIERDLKRQTGTTQFDVALVNPENIAVIGRMMRGDRSIGQREGKYEDDIRAATGSLLLPYGIPVAEQFSYWINSGEMQAKDLIDPQTYVQNRMDWEMMGLQNPAHAASLDVRVPPLPVSPGPGQSRKF